MALMATAAPISSAKAAPKEPPSATTPTETLSSEHSEHKTLKGKKTAAKAKAETKATEKTKPEKEKTWHYEVYAAGLHAVEADLTLGFSGKNRYDIRLDARTRGFLATLVPWDGTFETTGWKLGKDRFQPETHRSTATWRNEFELKEYHYSRGGKFLGYRVEIKGKKPKTRYEHDLADGTTDLLSATLAVMENVTQGGACKGKAEIFDGDRRYGVEFRSQGTETLTASEFAPFSGPAERCEVEVFPAGGTWHAKPRGWMSIQEQGRIQGALPTVWLAQLDKDKPAIPVRIRVKTEFGTLFMHMTGEKPASEPEQDAAQDPQKPKARNESQ